MPELNLGSSYNPTGDPLFHMPYQLRIDAIICGNSDSQNGGNTTTRINSKPISAYYPSGKLYKVFPSLRNAAAEVGFSPQTLRHRLKSGNINYCGYIWRRDG